MIVLQTYELCPVLPDSLRGFVFIVIFISMINVTVICEAYTPQRFMCPSALAKQCQRQKSFAIMLLLFLSK